MVLLMEPFDDNYPGPLRRRDCLVIGYVLGAMTMFVLVHLGWIR